MQPRNNECENDEHDPILDRNLKAIGQSMKLPAAPTAAQMNAWRGIAAEAHAGADDATADAIAMNGAVRAAPAARRAKQRRVLRWAGFGSALAACVAFGVMLLAPFGHDRVDAAEILASLADRLTSSIRLTISNIEDPDEGVRADGRVLIVFPEEGGGGRRGGVSGEFHIRGDADSKEFPGGEIDVAFALAPEQEWAYVKTRKLPREMVREIPGASIIYGMTCNGLLLRLDGLLEGKLLPGMDRIELDKILSETAGSIRSAAHQGGAALKAEVKLSSNADADDDADDNSDDDDADPKVTAAIQAGDEIQQMLTRLLTGQATAEELRQLVPLLQEAAGRVTVEPTPDGAYVLEASEFKADEGDADAEWIRRMTLRVVYRPQQGVERAEVLHLGPADGRVALEFGDGTLSDPLFNSERLVAPGRTSVVNVADFLKMFGPMMEQGGLNIHINSDQSDDDDDSNDADDDDSAEGNDNQ